LKKSTFGALLLMLLGTIAVLTWRFVQPLLFEKSQIETSDSDERIQLRIGGDNYLGYWFLASPEMRKLSARAGLAVEFIDDGGLYEERLKKFAAGDLDAIVLPVNSYLHHGGKVKFPGVIVASISESKGADGIVGYSDRLPTGKVEDLNDAGLKIVYTSASPSEFLLDLTMADFDLAELQASDEWRKPVGGSREVYEMAKKNQGDVFVLWEPDLSKAAALPGMKYVWGSDKFSGYIVDVLVVNRDWLKENRNSLAEFLKIYFRVLSIYSGNRNRMLEEMGKSTDLDENSLKGILKKIEWFDLEENRSLQFGLKRSAGEQVNDGLINTIISCTDVLVRTKRLDSDPLKGDPYIITNSEFLEELIKSSRAVPIAEKSKGVQEFEKLEASEWKRLREIGTFRLEPISFQQWNNALTDEGKAGVDKIAQLLVNNYPNYRIIVRGHTAPGGDEAENQKLSLERAQTVVQYLKAVHGINLNRLLAQGLGSKQPPRKKPGEGSRAYQYRLSRVEFAAVEAASL